MPTDYTYPNTKSILDTMLLLVTVLSYDKILLRTVLLQLESRITDSCERHHLSIARQVHGLNSTNKVAGAKLIRDSLMVGLKDSKELWELAECLKGHDRIL